MAALLPAGSTLIDGGNSFFQDDVRRAKMLQPKGINYLNVGTSGGVWGVERGYCLMIGGDRATVQRLQPIFTALAPGQGTIPPSPGREAIHGTAEQGFLHCGPAGAGHFVKMVHNGIEYGIMQAYAEGFDILRSVNTKDIPEDRRYDLNLANVAELWRRGSVIGSWLLDLTAMALAENPTLSNYTGFGAGFRRRTVDDQCRHRGSGAGRGSHGRAFRPVSFPPGSHFRGQNAFGHAPKIWRSCGTEGWKMKNNAN